MLCVRVVDLATGFLFKQEAADEMRISDWSSDVCSSDLSSSAAEGGRAVSVIADLGVEQPVERVDHEVDRKSVVWGKSVSVRVDLGGRRIIKKKIILIRWPRHLCSTTTA